MVAYLVAIVMIGVLCGGQKKDTKSYLLGGANMPYVALGISCLMAALSAFSLVAVPGEIFNHGLTLFVFGLLVPLFTVLTCAIFMKFYFRIGAFTPFEYLERRYSPGVRTLVAMLTIYLRLIYLGMVLFSVSKIFEGAAGWPAWVTVLLFGTISIVFTSSGGLKAVVWTDVMQFIVLIGGLFCILGALFLKVDGGFLGGIACAFRQGHGLNLFNEPEFYTFSPYVRLCIWLLILNSLLAPLSAMASDQMTVQRLLASGSYKNAIKTQLVNTSFTIPTMFILWTIGLMVFAYFYQHPELTPKSGDTALFQFITTELPSPLPGLVIAGMMAAVISTLNAVFNSLAAVYCKELHLRYFEPEMSEEKQVRISRIATVATGFIACSIGLFVIYSSDWLRQSVVEASVIFNAFDVIVIPAFLFAVLSRKASTLLVWCTAGMLWGIKLAMITWYTASTAAVNAWKPGMDPGWGGVIDISLGAWVMFGGIVLMMVWALLRRYRKRFQLLFVLLGTSVGGYGAGLLFWAVCSYVYCREIPRALSFQYLGLPVVLGYVILGTVWLCFGKVQPREKYQGLTLFDGNEVMQKG